MRELFWIISRRDTSVSVVDFFIYIFNRKGPNGNDYWRRSKSGCGALIVTRESFPVKKAGIHMHSHNLTTIIKFQMKVVLNQDCWRIRLFLQINYMMQHWFLWIVFIRMMNLFWDLHLPIFHLKPVYIDGKQKFCQMATF